MSPLKNTNKFLSDFLPPALVKDWRQCFRSRSSVALFILLELAGWLIFSCMVADADLSPSDYLKRMESMGSTLYGLGVFALCLIIPFRAGSTVSADTEVRSSNFLMLTPLSSRRIVWGTWSSTALIVLLAAVLALPLLFARRVMMTAYPHIGEIDLAAFNWEGFALDSLMLLWLVLAGWVMAGFYMFSAALPRILRVLLLIFCCGMTLSFMSFYVAEELFDQGDALTVIQTELPGIFTLALHVLDAVLLLVLFIELARRHYAAPAENCSRSVRLLAPLPLLVYGLLVALSLFGWEPVELKLQCTFALGYLFVALLSDALLPCYTMPAHAYRLWRGVPAWLQRPGFVPSTLCLALGSLSIMLLFVEPLWLGEEVEIQTLLRGFFLTMNIGMSLMLCLLITDCFCGRTATKRPLVFGVVAVACNLATLCLALPLGAFPAWRAALPLSLETGIYVVSDGNLFTAAMADGIAFAVFFLLLVFWRGHKV